MEPHAVNKKTFDLVLIVALLVPVALFPVRMASRRWVSDGNGALANVGAAAVIGGL
jgi:hypothetical protein